MLTLTHRRKTVAVLAAAVLAAVITAARRPEHRPEDPARAGQFRGLSASDLAYYDQARGRFTVAPGSYALLVGTT